MTYITQPTGRKPMSILQIMTMILIGFGLVVLQSSTVQAQWATNGNNINNTNTGNVGIGTTTPAYPLDVVAPSQWAARFRKTDATNGGIIIDSAAGYNPNLAFSVNGTFKWYLNSNTSSGDALQFWESTGLNPRFTLTQAGYLGLGTSSPLGQFSVVSNTGASNTMALFDAANDVGTAFPNLVFQRSRGTQAARTAVQLGDRLGGFAFRGYGATGFNLNNDNAVVRAFAAENFTDTAMGTYITFETTPTGTAARTEKLRISANGNVGIGTTTPGYKLDVNGTMNVQGGTTYFRQSSGLAGNEGALVSIGATGNNEASLALSVYRAGAYTNRFLVNNFGQVILQPNGDANVGIGTNTPSYKFDVQGGPVNASGGLCIAGDCKTAWSQVGGGSQWTTSGANVYYNTGSVGIGTTAPSSSLLHLQSGSNSYLRIGAPLGFQSSIAFNDDSNGQDIVLYRRENTRDFTIWTATASNTFSVTQAGNVGIGTTSPSTKLHVAGNGTIGGDLTVTGNIAAKYQDVAEWVQSSQELAAGTVVVLDQTKSNQVIASSQAYDTRVAGVISAQPGITLGEKGESKVLVATTGRVRIKVDASRGSIQIGDLLVTSDVPGVAMKSKPIDFGGVQIHRPGTLIGKALEPLEKETGEILVLLSLQ
jgi:hypothetical protein